MPTERNGNEIHTLSLQTNLTPRRANKDNRKEDRKQYKRSATQKTSLSQHPTNSNLHV